MEVKFEVEIVKEVTMKNEIGQFISKNRTSHGKSKSES